jgi:hypothetical protein
MHGRSIVLLLTATIDPGQTLMVARRDALVRLRDYQQALQFWLASGASRRVIFCENSGYDLSSLQELASDYDGIDVEFVSFCGNQSGAIKGKGHAELELIRHALETSRLIAGCDLIAKCTGRLIVRNAARILPSIAACEFDIMCTLFKHLSFADSRLFVATPAFLREYLLPKATMVDESAGVFFEHALACAAASAVGEGKRWRPFPAYPRIQGISGTHGTVISDSPVLATIRSLYHQWAGFVYRH